MDLTFFSEVMKKAEALTAEEIKAVGEKFHEPEYGVEILDAEVSESIKRLMCVSDEFARLADKAVSDLRELRKKNPGIPLPKELAAQATKLGEKAETVSRVAWTEIRLSFGDKYYVNEGVLSMSKGWKLTWLAKEKIDPVATMFAGMPVAIGAVAAARKAKSGAGPAPFVVHGKGGNA